MEIPFPGLWTIAQWWQRPTMRVFHDPPSVAAVSGYRLSLWPKCTDFVWTCKNFRKMANSSWRSAIAGGHVGDTKA
jgi:hypothetical protein